jgi:hypothetical protein
MTKELTPCNLIFFINAIACRANSPTSSGKSIVEIEKKTLVLVMCCYWLEWRTKPNEELGMHNGKNKI